MVISQDLDELLALSDSLAVINEGRLSPKRAIGDFSIDEIGLLMGGVHGEAEHGAHVRRPEWRRCGMLELEKRKEPSRAMVYLTPLIAVGLTMAVGALVFSAARLRRAGGGLGDVRRAADRLRASGRISG